MYLPNTPYIERSIKDHSVFFVYVSDSTGTKLYNWLLIPKDAFSDLFDDSINPGELKSVHLNIRGF